MPRRPPDAAPARLLHAESTAAAALALVQHPAVWEALTTLALISETVAARRSEGMQAIGAAVADILDAALITDADADQVVQLLSAVDTAARAWCTLAYPATWPATLAAPPATGPHQSQAARAEALWRWQQEPRTPD